MDAAVEAAITRHWNTLPVNIEQIIRDSGLALSPRATLDADVAGEIRRLDNGGYRISAQAQDHYYRRRFTMAHELGHYYLHRSLIGDGLDDNVKYRSTSSGTFYNKAVDLQHEKQANSFAAAVLMPEDPIKAEVRRRGGPPLSPEDQRSLAILCQVSPQALRIRLSELGMA